MISTAIKTAGGKWLLAWRVAGYVACFLVAAAVWVAPGWLLRGWKDAETVAAAQTEVANALRGLAEADAARIRADRQERQADAAEANAAAAFYESQLQKVEAARVSTSTQLRKALQRPVSCPAGGLALADVPVGADVLASLRDAGTNALAGIPAPGPSASQPDR